VKAPTSPPVVPARGRLFPAREAAVYLGVTAHRVRLLIARGELVALRNANGRLEGVYQADCDAWVDAHRRVAETSRRLSIDERIEALLPPPHERRFA